MKRSLFARWLFDKEDQVLKLIGKVLVELGWSVRALVFDGLMVEHRVDRAIAFEEAGQQPMGGQDGDPLRAARVDPDPAMRVRGDQVPADRNALCPKPAGHLQDTPGTPAMDFPLVVAGSQSAL